MTALQGEEGGRLAGEGEARERPNLWTKEETLSDLVIRCAEWFRLGKTFRSWYAFERIRPNSRLLSRGDWVLRLLLLRHHGWRDGRNRSGGRIVSRRLRWISSLRMKTPRRSVD